jgi:hypothetical protein
MSHRLRTRPLQAGKAGHPLHPAIQSFMAALSAALLAVLPPTHAEEPVDFATFERTISPAVRASLNLSDRGYRQLEPSLFHLLRDHADTLRQLPSDVQADRLAALGRLIESRRTALAGRPVIASGHHLIGLLDPARGLDPKEITAIAAAYGCTVEIFKQTSPSMPLEQVATDFLAAVSSAARNRGRPTTIVVLGHGLPEEIQSYHIPHARLASALLAPQPDQATTTTAVDLSHLTLICDDCFSADFLLNLGHSLTTAAQSRQQQPGPLPVMIAGTNRNCVGHADVGAKFVPHFWRNVIELFYIRRPRPKSITLGDFFDKIDNMLYGYGREPIVRGTKVVGYRLIDPELLQDPVVFIWLDDETAAKLRSILGLPPNAAIPPLFDIG